jgi:hypothetical protein
VRRPFDLLYNLPPYRDYYSDYRESLNRPR